MRSSHIDSSTAFHPWGTDTVGRYAGIEDEARITCLHPAIVGYLDTLGLQNAKLLDFGCGEGRLAETLAKTGAYREITLVDCNRSMIDLAAKRFESRKAVEKILGDESSVPSITYDLVLCSLVLMMCSTRNALFELTAALANRMSTDSVGVFAVTHPCFRSMEFTTISNKLPVGYEYHASGTPYEVTLRSRDGRKEVSFIDYHWTLQDYATAFARSGCMIARMFEIPGEVGGDNACVDPAYLTYVVKKVRAS